ncbi:MAG: BCCT family transporter, partial [Acidobacteriota bacterium]
GENAAIIGALMHVTDIAPLALIILVIFICVGFIYSATTVDSSAYSIAMVTSKGMTEGTDVEPHLFNRVIWAIFLGATALALMYQDEIVKQASTAAVAEAGRSVAETSGPGTTSVLVALKASSLVVAIPLMICISIAVLSLLKWLKEDKPHLEKSTLSEDDG